MRKLGIICTMRSIVAGSGSGSMSLKKRIYAVVDMVEAPLGIEPRLRDGPRYVCI